MNMKADINWIKERPVAHRGLHDKAAGRIENSLSAAAAAVENNYAIEVDLHPSSNRVPMVFHDDQLGRLTDEEGAFRELSHSELTKIRLAGSTDTVPTLKQLLELVAGKVGLVLELKGIAGEDEGFVAAVLQDLEDYSGPVAIMSFNHWLLQDAKQLGAKIPVGLTAEGGDELSQLHWQAVRDFDLDFVSYGIEDLPNSFVREFREQGGPVITWTIKNPELAQKSALYADQITFEGYLP